MRIILWTTVVWAVCAALLVGLAMNVRRHSNVITETRTFCAYGRIFVEFEENNRVWGTLMLDFYGRPIPCTEGKDLEIGNTI